jgi:hypothetical protein
MEIEVLMEEVFRATDPNTIFQIGVYRVEKGWRIRQFVGEGTEHEVVPMSFFVVNAQGFQDAYLMGRALAQLSSLMQLTGIMWKENLAAPTRLHIQDGIAILQWDEQRTPVNLTRLFRPTGEYVSLARRLAQHCFKASSDIYDLMYEKPEREATPTRL